MFLEFKGKGGTLEGEQIGRYVKFLKSNFKVSKLVTISTQYVADPSQRPYQMKSLPKGFDLFHMSWSHIKTMAHVLLFDNDDNVEDEDQVAILSEMLHHLESDSIGLKGYHQMRSGWKAFSEAFKTVEAQLEHLEEAVQSWLEEQTDMAHIQSQKRCVGKNQLDKERQCSEKTAQERELDAGQRGRFGLSARSARCSLIDSH